MSGYTAHLGEIVKEGEPLSYRGIRTRRFMCY